MLLGKKGGTLEKACCLKKLVVRWKRLILFGKKGGSLANTGSGGDYGLGGRHQQQQQQQQVSTI